MGGGTHGTREGEANGRWRSRGGGRLGCGLDVAGAVCERRGRVSGGRGQHMRNLLRGSYEEEVDHMRTLVRQRSTDEEPAQWLQLGGSTSYENTSEAEVSI